MANKPLKSIKFPGLNDTYTIPQVDSTLAVSGAAADAKKTGDAIGDLKSASTKLNDYIFAENSYTLDTALKFYDIPTKSGDVITIKNVTGQNFSATFGLIFYKEDQTTSETITLSNTQSSRTYTLEDDWAYIRPNYAMVDTIEVTIKTGTGAKEIISQNQIDIADLKQQDALMSNVMPQLVNLFDKTTVVEGKQINPNTGAEGNGWNCTDYIPIRKDCTYYVSVIVPSASALYNTDKGYFGALSEKATVVQSGISNLWSFTSPIDGYFRGTLYSLNLKDYIYFSPYINAFVPNGYVDYSYVSNAVFADTGAKSIGADTNNMFIGGSVWATFNSNTGGLEFDPERIITPEIAISGAVYWFTDTDVTGIVQYILQYDDEDTFLGAITTSAKPVGYAVLNADTVKIRICTKTFRYGEITTQWFDRILYVTDSFEKLGKYITNLKNVDQSVVSTDFFTHSVKFRHSYIENAIRQYQKEINMTGYDFVMPIMTDIHNVDSEPYKMLTYMAETGTADICMNLGDNIPDHFDDGDLAVDFHAAIADWSRSPYAKCPQIVLRGNHDNNPVTGNDQTEMISDAEYYNLYHERTIHGFAGINKNYGYIDFEQSKIRLIFLDSGDIYAADGSALTSGYNVAVGQEQVNWFISEALNFSDKTDKTDWEVITCSHAQLKQLAEEMFNAILYAFMHGTTASGTVTQTFSDTGLTRNITYNADFTQQGGMEYVCHLNGHNHWDDAFLMGNTGRYDIDICSDINNGGKRVNGSTQKYTYTAGTINERCMDTLCLDKSTKTIYMKRLGVGENRSYSYQ